jgi:Methyltransferase domain
MRFDPGSRSLLSRHDLARFPAATLFDKLARSVCAVDCLPRKELYESWEVARRVRRRFRGGRVVDLACGHGLTGWIMLILDRSSEHCVGIDRRLPESARRLHDALASTWPAIAPRVTLREGDLADEPLHAGDLVVATHACGSLTDRVLERAAAARARVAVLPCCHDTSHPNH